MSRLVVSDLRLVLDLVTPGYHLSRPWHDEELDQDVVTNGHALLTWEGHSFAPGPIDGVKVPRVLDVIPRGGEVLGTPSFFSLREWCEPIEWHRHCQRPAAHDPDHDLGGGLDCPGKIQPPRCSVCGLEDQRGRPGRLYGVVINRALLERYLRPVLEPDKVTVRGDTDVLCIAGNGWELVIMRYVADDPMPEFGSRGAR